MSDQSKSRFAVDLDDLERQLRHTAGAQPRASQSDPLAELARIVGQDDPFKAMFADRKPAAPLPTAKRVEASLDDLLRDIDGRKTVLTEAVKAEQVPVADASQGPSRDTLIEFDALLRDELRGSVSPVAAQTAPIRDVDQQHINRDFGSMSSRRDVQQPITGNTVPAQDLDDLSERIRAEETLPPDMSQDAAYPEPPVDEQDDMRSLEPQQPRRGLVIAGALLGVAVLGIGAVVGMRGFSSAPKVGADAPIIKAETGPSKVQPQNPGGVEIPNQNKQIYERTPEPRAADTRVVNREEQPVDVQALTRSTPRVILPGPGAGTAGAGTPGGATAQAALPAQAASTPSTAPSGPVAGLPASGSASGETTVPAPALGEPRRVRTVSVRPDGSIAPVNGSAPVTAQAASPAAQASRIGAVPPAALTTPPAAPPRAVSARSDEVATARPAVPRPPERVQTAAAPATAPAVVPPATPPRSTEAPATTGGFMIQLGAPGSESEARATYASLQRRYSEQLGSDSPTIRRADIGNGKTVYRLRVGPYTREQAAEKCQALQSAGGQCFIARN